MFAIGISKGFSAEGFSISDLAWFGTVMLQVIALATVITLITIIFGNIYGGLTASVITLFALCNIMRNFTASPIFRSSCFCFAVDSSSTTLIRCVIGASVTIVAAMIAAYAVFRKRDLS